MSCDQSQYLDAYLDGQLSAEEQRRMDQHLAACPPCARELTRLRRLSALISSYHPPGLPADVLERIHEVVAGQQSWDFGILSLARRISAVAAAVVLGGSLYLTFFQTDQATAASLPDWEQTAVSGVPDVQPAAADQAQLAEWIVSDLSSSSSASNAP